MASIIKASINLNNIPKDKIYVGKKGKYLPITITINDEVECTIACMVVIEVATTNNNVHRSQRNQTPKSRALFVSLEKLRIK